MEVATEIVRGWFTIALWPVSRPSHLVDRRSPELRETFGQRSRRGQRPAPSVRGWFTGLMLVGVCFATVQAAPHSELEKANAALKTATAEKAAAEKALAEKVAAAKTATEKAAVAKAAADKAAAEKTAAAKLLADKEAALKAAVANAVAAQAAARVGLKPLAADAWDYAKARHLLVRTGFGGTPDEVTKLHAVGLHEAVNHVLDFGRPSTENIANKTSSDVGNRLTQRGEREQAARIERFGENAQLQRFREWWLYRMMESPRPLQEKLTLFWHGHFTSEYDVVRNIFAFHRQNDMFRDHAAGNFGVLLHGIVHDPVMIRYLDNNQNYKGHPNENLAREIMELFAMGLDQGYTEEDIKEAARALTGYSYDGATARFRFDPAQHDPESKTIFGQTGNWTGDDLVRLILEQPATSQFIAGKLFGFFAYNDAEPETIERLATLFMANNYELAPMLKNLFLSEEFYSARSMGTQIKSPVQLVVGMLRDFGVKDVDTRAVHAAIRDMGQELLEPPDVKGWREGRAWINAHRLFTRYNTMANLVRSIAHGDNRKGIDVVAVIEGQDCESVADVVDCLAKACLVLRPNDTKRKELIAHLGELPARSEWEKQRNEINGKLLAFLVLIVSTPEYQFS